MNGVVAANGTCSSGVWLSTTSVKCIAPQQQYSRNPGIMITISGIVGTRLRHFTFDAPSVTHGSIPNAAQSGYGVLSILGLNMGAVDGTPTAFVGTWCRLWAVRGAR